jgi:16S rRNA (cytidine1402-2'-O)-methyltransferase
LRILGEVDYVLCEDTRVTGNLLKQHGITAKLKRYDAHASLGTHETVVRDLVAGKAVALVSDAGTPGVSDPGVLLVQEARRAGVRIDAIPGPSSVTAAISIAGLPGNQFTFLGFVPQKKGRETFFKSLASFTHPVAFFESTHRILKTLTSLQEYYPQARVSVGREITKLHEEMLVGTATEILTTLTTTPVKQKGEFILILSPGTE